MVIVPQDSAKSQGVTHPVCWIETTEGRLVSEAEALWQPPKRSSRFLALQLKAVLQQDALTLGYNVDHPAYWFPLINCPELSCLLRETCV